MHSAVTGFITHEGNSPYGGHYTCHVKKGDGWFLCNDLKVDQQAATAAQAAMQDAYILMLCKQ